MAQINDGFAENTPEKMRSMVLEAGYKICEEDVTSMWHSSIVRFTLYEPIIFVDGRGRYNLILNDGGNLSARHYRPLNES